MKWGGEDKEEAGKTGGIKTGKGRHKGIKSLERFKPHTYTGERGGRGWCDSTCLGNKLRQSSCINCNQGQGIEGLKPGGETRPRGRERGGRKRPPGAGCVGEVNN